MADPTDDNMSDHDLFKKAMQDVMPLNSKNIIPATLPARKYSPKTEKTNEKDTISLSDHCAEDILPEQHLSFVKSGVQPHYFRQLKQGKIPIQAELDLHGSTVDKAREEFIEFIQVALERGYRCIRIIHGKGYRSHSRTPILKSKVFTWLMQMPDILAFSSCQPKDGGTGAVYVLLRKV